MAKQTWQSGAMKMKARTQCLGQQETRAVSSSLCPPERPCVLPAYMSVHHVCVWSPGGKKSMSYPIDLELQAVESCHVGAVTQVLCRSSKCSQPLSLLSKLFYSLQFYRNKNLSCFYRNKPDVTYTLLTGMFDYITFFSNLACYINYLLAINLLLPYQLDINLFMVSCYKTLTQFLCGKSLGAAYPGSCVKL